MGDERVLGDVWFGLKPPADAVVAWGARAIFQVDQRGEISLDYVWDRQSWFGEKSDCFDLDKWVNANIITNLRYIVEEENLDPGEDREILRAIKTAQGEEICSKPPRILPYGGSRKKRTPVYVLDVGVKDGLSSSWGEVHLKMNPKKSHGYLYLVVWRTKP